MKTKTLNPEPCACCSDLVTGERFYSEGVGTVCKDCADGLHTAIRALYRAGLSSLFFGHCGDNDAGKEAA